MTLPIYHTRQAFQRIARLRLESRCSVPTIKRGYLQTANIRTFASSSGTNDETETPPVTSTATEWRKKQLDKLEKKFTEPLKIDSDEDLQPMWKEMESRVTKRKPRTLRETGGKSGRINIRKTDEEIWLREGLYDDDSKQKK